MFADVYMLLMSTDPTKRLTLEMVAVHPWIVGEEGPIPYFLCWCKRNTLQREQMSDGNITESSS